MMVHAFQTITGLSPDASAGFVTALVVMLFVGIYAVGAGALLYFFGDFPRQRAPAQRQSVRLSGYPPAEQYGVLHAGHPDCAGKFCELRGCAIIGTCQAPRRTGEEGAR